jgi:hypothetical protein
MLLYISLLNCFLALLMLVFNWRKNRNVLFLSLLILLISIYTITFQFIVVDQSRFWAAIFYANLAPLWYRRYQPECNGEPQWYRFYYIER